MNPGLFIGEHRSICMNSSFVPIKPKVIITLLRDVYSASSWHKVVGCFFPRAILLCSPRMGLVINTKTHTHTPWQPGAERNACKGQNSRSWKATPVRTVSVGRSQFIFRPFGPKFCLRIGRRQNWALSVVYINVYSGGGAFRMQGLSIYATFNVILLIQLTNPRLPGGLKNPTVFFKNWRRIL